MTHKDWTILVAGFLLGVAVDSGWRWLTSRTRQLAAGVRARGVGGLAATGNLGQWAAVLALVGFVVYLVAH